MNKLPIKLVFLENAEFLFCCLAVGVNDEAQVGMFNLSWLALCSIFFSYLE